MDRIEKDVHQFWLSVCGVDTYRRSSQHARHDTPWNAFSEDHVLVCTLWQDQIVTRFDPVENKDRRFVRIGGKRKIWKGPAIAHGKEADRNFQHAFDNNLRVVGYEAMPDKRATTKGKRKVAHFFLDRVHELKRLFNFSQGNLIGRLELEQAFQDAGRDGSFKSLDAGYIFELVAPKGTFPGAEKASRIAALNPDDTSEPEVAPERETRPEGVRDAEGIGESHATTDGSESDDSSFLDNVEEAPGVTEGYALRSIPILIEHILRQKDDVLVPMTYTQLAQRLDRRNKHGKFWARGLGHVLGRVTALIDGLRTYWAEPVPYLTTVVVDSQGQNKGLPGIGIRGKWAGYDKLTRIDKEAQVAAEHQRILRFGSRWNDVLSMLGLPMIEASASASASASSSTDRPRGGGGGGESEEHFALKTFVQRNPHLVGADASWSSANEYALRSGDELDVFFKSDDQWIGVEVKSRVSDGLERDYERGLYQVVKYRAVLDAQARMDRPGRPPSVRVILVLESKLPEKYRAVAHALGVELKENVKPIPAAKSTSGTAPMPSAESA